MNANTIFTAKKEIWLVGAGNFHVVIPAMAAIRFIEAYFGVTHTQDILRTCSTNVKRINDQLILNRNFLSWTPWNKRLTQCIFRQAKPLECLALEFSCEVTSKIFKIIESDKAAMVISVDTSTDNELLCLSKKYIGISDPVLVADNICPRTVLASYHNYVTPGVIGAIENNPTPALITNMEHVNVGRILQELV